MKWIFMFFVATNACAVEVAFLEVLDWHREPVRLQPGARFAHVAIKYQGQWLHSHPQEPGVILTSDLSHYGRIKSILIHPDIAEPSKAQVERWLGKPFDNTFTWRNTEATYCSRLVAQFLKVKPTPMRFVGKVWRGFAVQRFGKVGMSPDKLHSALLDRGYVESCSTLLEVQK